MVKENFKIKPGKPSVSKFRLLVFDGVVAEAEVNPVAW